MLTLLCALLAFVVETPIPAAPTGWLADTVGRMSSAKRQELDARLETYQRQTGHQVVVWIGQLKGDTPLGDWAVRTFAAWKLGRKGVDDGVALFIRTDLRTIAIEVGYGLEGQLPDAVASRIIREAMAPRLRAGDLDGAVQAGVSGLLGALGGEDPATARQRRAPSIPLGQWILFGVLGLFFLVLLITHPSLALLFLMNILSGGRRGFGEGGGGGPSGGGGRSGGGGARGSW